MRAKFVLLATAVILSIVGNSLAQSNPAPTSPNLSTATTPDSQVAPDPKDAIPDAKIVGNLIQDPAGRPVWTSPDPQVQPTPPSPDRPEFEQNVKDVYFDFNRANLTAEDRATLQKDAAWLKAHPNVMFTIAGGADERGTIPYNLFLSDQRALVTRDALLKLGVPENQILFATGWGKIYPVCAQSDDSCWSQNRRSHLAAWPPPENPLGPSAQNEPLTAPAAEPLMTASK
jgi:outer membrane protein OmpA-like peptidoglycan-associated protein